MSKDSDKLAGMKFAVDDSVLVLGHGSTAIGEMLRDFKSPIQATAVDRLLEAGAVLVDSTDDAKFTIGVDTGGEVRELALKEKLYGFRPTYGAISRHGIIDMASSMDTIGVMAERLSDIEAACEAMVGPDGKDSTVYPVIATPDFDPGEAIQTNNLDRHVADAPRDDKLHKIGFIKEFSDDNTVEFVKNLRKNGYEVEEVELPMAKYATAIYQTIMPAEMSSNFMRYDGVRYGKRSNDAKTWDDIIRNSRGEGFSDEIKRRIMMGFHVLSTENFESHYMQACRARTMLINEFNDLFEKYDFLVGTINETMMIAASLAGLPALVLPTGEQIIGPMKSDMQLLDFAKEIK